MYTCIEELPSKEDPLFEMVFISLFWLILSEEEKWVVKLIQCWGRGDGLPRLCSVKHPPANVGDVGLIPGSGRSPGEGNGNPLQDSCLENPMNRGDWQAAVHGVAKSWIWLRLNRHAQGRGRWINKGVKSLGYKLGNGCFIIGKAIVSWNRN